MCVAAELRAVDVISSYQFEEKIGAASSENGLFITKMEFPLRTAVLKQPNSKDSSSLMPGVCCARLQKVNDINYYEVLTRDSAILNRMAHLGMPDSVKITG